MWYASAWIALIGGVSLDGSVRALGGGGAVGDEAMVRVGRVAADGVQLPQDASGLVRVKAYTRMVDVDFSTGSGGGRAPLRYRFQLEGVDAGWRDPLGVMRFTVRFNDSKGNAVSGEEFDAHGQSPGWTGALETSAFIPRRASLEVPAGAARLQIWMGSAGPAQTMGVYALDGLAVTLVPADPQQASQRVELISGTGSLLDQPEGTPLGWARHGNRLGVAQIGPRRGRPPLMVMRDDRPDAFGGWLTGNEHSPLLEGIRRVDLEWREAYSIGWGGSARQSYAYLPAGEYRLRLQDVTLEGQPMAESSVTRIVVVPPFYEAPWFRVLLGLAVVGGAAGWVRRATRLRMQRRLDTLERERVVDRERSRIARDLHDNLGADLTHLALISDLAHADAADPDKVRKCFDQIFETARNLTRQVDEIVWAVNPANDSLNGFVPFLSNYAQHFLSAAEVACRLEIPASLPDTPLSSAERHALLMLVKEALHNVVKHAHATEVRLRIRAEGSLLEIVVEDDGCGMAERVVEGDGTGNMRQRAAAIGASLERWSSPGGGTTLRVRLGLKGSV
ncbi:MAG: hypothetical protein RLZZ142_2380 [Verrucomicrobiota bacterium]